MKNPSFKFTIWFYPDDKGKRPDIDMIIIQTKPMPLHQAQKLAIEEAERIWHNYQIEMSSINITPSPRRPK